MAFGIASYKDLMNVEFLHTSCAKYLVQTLHYYYIDIPPMFPLKATISRPFASSLVLTYTNFASHYQLLSDIFDTKLVKATEV